MRYEAVSFNNEIKYNYVSNTKGSYDVNLFVDKRMVPIEVSDIRIFKNYLGQVEKCLKYNKINDVEDVSEDNKVCKSTFISEVLSVLTINIFPLLNLFLVIFINNYRRIALRIVSVLWISIFFTIPCILSIIIERKCLIKRRYVKNVSIIGIIILVVLTITSLLMVKVFDISYDKQRMTSVERKINYSFPSNSLYEEASTYYGIKSFVTVLDTKEFDDLYNKIEDSDEWIQNLPSDLPDFIYEIIDEPGVDYSLVCYVDKNLFNENVDFYGEGEYIIVALDKDEKRFCIYNFSLTSIGQ